MKNYVIILICVLVSSIALGQNQKVEEMKNVLEKSEVEVNPPKFTGIKDVLKFENDINSNSISQYVADNYPVQDNSEFSEGTEVIRFNITSEGKLTDFKVINSVSYKIDEEIIDIIKTSEGMWKPGYNNQKAVTMEKEVILKIKSNLNRDFLHTAKIYFKKGTENLFVKGNLKRALKNFNYGIRYRPYDQSLCYMRGLCRYEMGDEEGAREDWAKLRKIRGIDMSDKFAEYNVKELKGYEELTTVLLADDK